MPRNYDSGVKQVEITGNTLLEQKTEVDVVAGVLTFSQPIDVVEIFNTDATNSGMFIVNGVGITMPAGKSFKASVGVTPSKLVTVTGATTYIVSRYV